MKTIAASLFLMGMQSFLAFASDGAIDGEIHPCYLKAGCPTSSVQPPSPTGWVEQNTKAVAPPIDDECNEEGICPAPSQRRHIAEDSPVPDIIPVPVHPAASEWSNPKLMNGSLTGDPHGCPKGWRGAVDDEGYPICVPTTPYKSMENNPNSGAPQVSNSSEDKLQDAATGLELSAPAQIIAAPVNTAPWGPMDKRSMQDTTLLRNSSIHCPPGEEENSDDQGNLYCSKPLHQGPCLDECI